MREFVLLCGVATLCAVGACSPRTVENKIAARVDHSCGRSSQCVIRVADVTDFAWDRMVVLRADATPEDIATILGQPYADYREFHRRLIFVKGRQIVHREEHWTDMEGPTNGEVMFPISDAEKGGSFTPTTAVFSARRDHAGKVSFVVLRQIADASR